MWSDIKARIGTEIKLLFQLRKTERLWHIPVLASLCTGLPLLLGYFIGRLDYGILACLGGLVILYLPDTKLEHRMVTLLLCAFGFILSFTVGIVFSFNPYAAALTLGVFAFAVNWITNYFKLQPPGNFFFIMIASMASCMPFDVLAIPTKIGLLALGTILACVFALLYSLYITRKFPDNVAPEKKRKRYYTNITESVTIGVFVGFSLFVGHIFSFDNPYWLPISCLAIMQGVTVVHVWQRSFHRILGTFIGMGATWLLLQLELTPLQICFCILILQFIIEMLVVRHYALAMIFITPMTVFLADIGRGLTANPDQLIAARILDIIVGSTIGILGGWILHNQQLHHKAGRQVRKVRISQRFKNGKQESKK